MPAKTKARDIVAGWPRRGSVSKPYPEVEVSCVLTFAPAPPPPIEAWRYFDMLYDLANLLASPPRRPPKP